MKIVGMIVLLIVLVLLGIDNRNGRKNSEKAIKEALLEKGYSDILFISTKTRDFSNFRCKSFVEEEYPAEFKIAAVKNGNMRKIVACMGRKETKYYDNQEKPPVIPLWVEEEGFKKEYNGFK